MTDPKMAYPKFARDLAFYRAKFAEQQAESDVLNDEFGFPRVDLAYSKAVERARFRKCLGFAAQKRHFKFGLERNRFTKATVL